MVPVGTQPDKAYFVRKQSRERFKELCEHAEVVDDPEELAKIASRIESDSQIRSGSAKERHLDTASAVTDPRNAARVTASVALRVRNQSARLVPTK
jgi:hypothetical protein